MPIIHKIKLKHKLANKNQFYYPSLAPWWHKIRHRSQRNNFVGNRSRSRSKTYKYLKPGISKYFNGNLTDKIEHHLLRAPRCPYQFYVYNI